MRKRILIGLICLFGLTGITEAKDYLCIADSVTGFAYNNYLHKWVSGKFRPGTKYLIKPDKGSKIDKYVISVFGKDEVAAICQYGISKTGFLDCSWGYRNFHINVQTGRYIKTFDYGYFNIGRKDYISGKMVTNKNSYTPTMEIGKCSPL